MYKVFSVVDISAHTNYLIGRIHSKDGTDKKFVTLDKKEFAYVENFSIIYGLDFGYTTVSFVMGNNKLLDGVRFYIYDEEGTLIEDADGYATDYEFALPVVNDLVVVASLTVAVLDNVAVIVTALLLPFTTVIAPEDEFIVAPASLLLAYVIEPAVPPDPDALAVAL